LDESKQLERARGQFEAETNVGFQERRLMYIPKVNRVDDPKEINVFIHAHGFAMLITDNGAAISASHLLVLLD
jgi:hypothetical protein